MNKVMLEYCKTKKENVLACLILFENGIQTPHSKFLKQYDVAINSNHFVIVHCDQKTEVSLHDSLTREISKPGCEKVGVQTVQL